MRTDPPVSAPFPSAGAEQRVLLAAGSGGRATSAFVARHFGALAAARPPLQDAATLAPHPGPLAFTTDAFVVTPAEFPGGDIGSLAVYGTVNDLAVVGAYPRWLSAAFVLEEGLSTDLLARVVHSLGRAAAESGVAVVAADTKVVERGAADGIYIITSGVGELRNDVALGSDRARPGDAVLVSGTLGDHGMAVMAQRAALPLDPPIASDCASVAGLVHMLLDAVGPRVRCLRDPTRGGVAAALNEIAADSSVSISLDDDATPLRATVRAACELLGFDPTCVASEGRFIAILDSGVAEEAVFLLRTHPLGRDATVIGQVTERVGASVKVRTRWGAERTLDSPSGELLPRIC